MSGSRLIAVASRVLVVATLAACLVTAAGPMANPSAVAASTADTMELKILGLINVERANRGLVPLKLDGALADLAGDRAASMASTGTFAHPSCLSCVVNARHIQYYGTSEVIAWTTWPWGDQAAQSVFNAWKGSPLHWSILMSNKYNYIGIGVAYRSSSHKTYASGNLTEAKDHTKPWAKMSTRSRSGTTVRWTWTGADTKLQTHTAGLKNFDVQYRVGSGTWKTIRSGTTATSLSLSSRAHGHYYGLRVRARDNLGYLSSYSAELRIWVP